MSGFRYVPVPNEGRAPSLPPRGRAVPEARARALTSCALDALGLARHAPHNAQITEWISTDSRVAPHWVVLQIEHAGQLYRLTFAKAADRLTEADVAARARELGPRAVSAAPA